MVSSQGFFDISTTDMIAKKAGTDQLARRTTDKYSTLRNRRFDEVEQSILQTLKREWSWLGSRLLNHLHSCSIRLAGYSIKSEFTRLQLEALECHNNLRAIIHQAEAELEPLRTFFATRQEPKEFKARHRQSLPFARTPQFVCAARIGVRSQRIFCVEGN